MKRRKKRIKMTRVNLAYIAYLNTPEWKERREEFLEEANHECEECGSSKNLQVHHLTYDNLGHEEFDDVEVLCDVCHEDKELEKGTDLYDGEDDYGEY